MHENVNAEFRSKVCHSSIEKKYNLCLFAKTSIDLLQSCSYNTVIQITQAGIYVPSQVTRNVEEYVDIRREIQVASTHPHAKKVKHKQNEMITSGFLKNIHYAFLSFSLSFSLSLSRSLSHVQNLKLQLASAKGTPKSATTMASVRNTSPTSSLRLGRNPSDDLSPMPTAKSRCESEGQRAEVTEGGKFQRAGLTEGRKSAADILRQRKICFGLRP